MRSSEKKMVVPGSVVEGLRLLAVKAAIMMSVFLTARRGLTAGDRSILTAINTDVSSLSFVSSTFIILCYSRFNKLRKFSVKLVFYLALSSKLKNVYF
ncbi:unnamed protein product [Brassica rapa subsp. trilocularis]